jgi:hypothetical protein
MDIHIAGSWAETSSGASNFSLPAVTGLVQLHNLRATVRGVSGPIEVASANLRLSPDATRVENLSASAAGARWTGSLSLPRGCGTSAACTVRFNLNTDVLIFAGIREWLGPQPGPRRWYQVLTGVTPEAPSFLQTLHASGTLNAKRFSIHNMDAGHVSASLDMDRGKLKISDLRAEVLGGKHRGDWQLDFTGLAPLYTGSGALSGISLDELADAMHDPWISGTAGATYRLTASGADAAAFWQSAEGTLQFDLRDGILPHLSLSGDDVPLRISRWEGRAQLRDGKIGIEKGTLFSPTGAYEVSGTASLGRVLDFRLSGSTSAKASGAGAMVYSITGTLAEPHVRLEPTAETQAQLKH